MINYTRPDIVANCESLLTLQKWMTPAGGKAAIAITGLAKEGVQKTYVPCQFVLEALLALCEVSINAHGQPCYKHVKKFTDDGWLNTNLAELGKAVKKIHNPGLGKRVIQQSLLILARAGIIEKTKCIRNAYEGARILILLSGKAVIDRIESEKDCSCEHYKGHNMLLPPALPGEYGFDPEWQAEFDKIVSELNRENGENSEGSIRHDRAPYIYINTLLFSGEQNHSGNTEELSSQCLGAERPKEESLRDPLFSPRLRKPLPQQVKQDDNGQWCFEMFVPYQVRRILDAIKSDENFICAERPFMGNLTAQEVMMTIKAVEKTHMTLKFIMEFRYHVRSLPLEAPYMNISWGRFCEQFFRLKCQFYIDLYQQQVEGLDRMFWLNDFDRQEGTIVLNKARRQLSYWSSRLDRQSIGRTKKETHAQTDQRPADLVGVEA